LDDLDLPVGNQRVHKFTNILLRTSDNKELEAT
jgi:hypothetical protein